MNVEFSQSQLVPDGSDLYLAEAHHLGHEVQRIFTTERSTGERLEAIRGMVVENRSTELMPAQLEQTFRRDGTLEERRLYYAPYAWAIAYPHLEEFVLETLGPREASPRAVAPTWLPAGE